jgi:hypothetical protein
MAVALHQPFPLPYFLGPDLRFLRSLLAWKSSPPEPGPDGSSSEQVDEPSFCGCRPFAVLRDSCCGSFTDLDRPTLERRRFPARSVRSTCFSAFLARTDPPRSSRLLNAPLTLASGLESEPGEFASTAPPALEFMASSAIALLPELPTAGCALTLHIVRSAASVGCSPFNLFFGAPAGGHPSW